MLMATMGAFWRKSVYLFEFTKDSQSTEDAGNSAS